MNYLAPFSFSVSEESVCAGEPVSVWEGSTAPLLAELMHGDEHPHARVDPAAGR